MYNTTGSVFEICSFSKDFALWRGGPAEAPLSEAEKLTCLQSFVRKFKKILFKTLTFVFLVIY